MNDGKEKPVVAVFSPRTPESDDFSSNSGDSAMFFSHFFPPWLERRATWCLTAGSPARGKVPTSPVWRRVRRLYTHVGSMLSRRPAGGSSVACSEKLRRVRALQGSGREPEMPAPRRPGLTPPVRPRPATGSAGRALRRGGPGREPLEPRHVVPGVPGHRAGRRPHQDRPVPPWTRRGNGGKRCGIGGRAKSCVRPKPHVMAGSTGPVSSPRGSTTAKSPVPGPLCCPLNGARLRRGANRRAPF